MSVKGNTAIAIDREAINNYYFLLINFLFYLFK